MVSFLRCWVCCSCFVLVALLHLLMFALVAMLYFFILHWCCCCNSRFFCIGVGFVVALNFGVVSCRGLSRATRRRKSCWRPSIACQREDCNVLRAHRTPLRQNGHLPHTDQEPPAPGPPSFKAGPLSHYVLLFLYVSAVSFPPACCGLASSR